MAKKAGQAIDLGFLRGNEGRTDLSGMFASSVANESEMQQAQMVKVDRLLDNPYQPRQLIRDDTIDELAQVMRSQGFQGVLVARPHPDEKGIFQLTAGHRRREAARRAGLVALPVVVKQLTDEEMVTLAITENIQREDLTPLEEGRIYLLMGEEMGYTHEQIAREVGRKRGYIENRIRVARAPKDVQDLVQAKPDSIRAVANLIKVKDAHERAEIIEHLLEGSLTVEDLQGYVASRHKHADTAGEAAEGVAAESASSAGDPADPKANGHAGHDQQVSTRNRGTPALAAHGGLRGDADERKRLRIGSAKLAAVLRYLNAYREHASTRKGVSVQEQASLAHIKALVDDLNERLVERDM